MKAPVEFTYKALGKLWAYVADKGIVLRKTYLRIEAKDAGCRGFSYLLEFTEEKRPFDHELEIANIRVLIDPESYTKLEGTIIDYAETPEDLLNTGFVFLNPNVKLTCGCGKSHSPDERKS